MSATIYKAVKYIRISYTNDKTCDSASVATQRKLLDRFIESQPDIEAVSERIDDGVSGIIFDRPAFNEMMSDIESGEVNCIIVKDLSRLGREYIETGRYLRQIFPAYGVRSIALDDNIDTLRDDDSNLFVSVKSIFNDAYCHDISVKIRAAIKAKCEKGEYIGACPVYGYKKSKDNRNQLAIDEYPAGIVRDIFRMKIDGMSAWKIAWTLNELGVLSPLEYKRTHGLPHPKGGYADIPNAKWSATTIIRILKDETYTGMLIQGRRGTPNYKLKTLINKPKSEWKRTENAHEAIISSQDFDLIQQIMRLDTRTVPGNDKVYAFSGLLICGCCGARMTRKSVSYKDKSYYYYVCPTTKKRGCADAAMLKEAELCEYVLKNVKAYIAGVIYQESLTVKYSGAMNPVAEQYMAQISENKLRLEEINIFKNALYESMVDGFLTKMEYKDLKAEYTAAEAHLHDAITEIEDRLKDMEHNKRQQWAEQINRFENMTELDRRTVVTLVHSIRVVSKTDLRITFNNRPDDMLALIFER